MLVLLPFLAGLTLAFQNCSPVKFTQMDLGSLSQPSTDCVATPSAEGCPPVIPPPVKCSFNGQEYTQDQTVTAYLASSVPAGQSCQSEERKCVDGAFSGSYQYAACTVDAPSSCLFNGQTVAHEATVTAYQSSSVAFGGSCVSESRVCNNGELSGSFSYASCNVAAPAACLFNGQTIAHGSAVKAYQNSSVAYGGTCSSEDRTCNNGVLSGSFSYASCNVNAPASCLFDGQTIAHGASAKAYQASSVPYGSTCSSQDRVCNNGSLSGTYTFGSCNVDAPAACLFNGQTVAHGATVKGYQTSSVAFGQTCVSQDRTCSNGVLSGSYSYGACNVNAPASCLFDGQTVAHGESVTAYLASTVISGTGSCSSQVRTCTNGVLSGTYTKPSCAVTCSTNYGLACTKSSSYYYTGPRFKTYDECLVYSGNAGATAPCPAPSPGNTYLFKQCKSDSTPTNGYWYNTFMCAQGVTGTYSCSGTCE
jgi:hypothetical protein